MTVLANRNKLVSEGDVPQEPLRTADAALAGAYAKGRRRDEKLTAEQRRAREAEDPWLQRLRAGDLSGPTLRPAQYIRLRTEAIEGNPRHTPEY